jgi:hypothetical protein
VLSVLHEALDRKDDFLHVKTTFATAPSLVVLHELSLYFVDDPEATYVVIHMQMSLNVLIGLESPLTLHWLCRR